MNNAATIDGKASQCGSRGKSDLLTTVAPATNSCTAPARFPNLYTISTSVEKVTYALYLYCRSTRLIHIMPYGYTNVSLSEIGFYMISTAGTPTIWTTLTVLYVHV